MDKPPIPPTIGHLRSMGLTGLTVTCSGVECHHAVDMRFDDLGLAEEVEFPQIVTLKRFWCSRCGSDRVTLMPDWRGQRAPSSL